MPVRMMAVIGSSKHRPRLIPELAYCCQTGATDNTEYNPIFSVNPRLKSPSRNIGPGLHYVDLSLHVRPLNILVAAAKHTLDLVRRSYKPADDIVSQHHPIALDRHLLHATLLVKRQQTILIGARQHLYRIAARAEEYLLGNAFTLDHFDPQA